MRSDTPSDPRPSTCKRERHTTAAAAATYLRVDVAAIETTLSEALPHGSMPNLASIRILDSKLRDHMRVLHPHHDPLAGTPWGSPDSLPTEWVYANAHLRGLAHQVRLSLEVYKHSQKTPV